MAAEELEETDAESAVLLAAARRAALQRVRKSL